MSDNSRATPMTFKHEADIERLAREIDSCGECRVEIGGPDKYKVLNKAEIIAIVDALNLLKSISQPGQIEHFETLKTTRPVKMWEREVGEFHGFFNGNPDPVAVVELESGNVMAVDCEMIRFLDREE